jgi:hypothetical protein
MAAKFHAADTHRAATNSPWPSHKNALRTESALFFNNKARSNHLLDVRCRFGGLEQKLKTSNTTCVR